MSPADAAAVPMVTARARRKRPHDLHLSTTSAELVERLRAQNVDLLALIREFVRPGAQFGAILGGSLADGTATSLSDVDVIVLLPDRQSLKSGKTSVFGHTATYLPEHRSDQVLVSLFIHGVEFEMQFYMNAEAHAGRRASRVGSELGREGDPPAGLNSPWVLAGREVVERWRHYFHAESMPLSRAASEFILGTKLLEDMRACIGGAPGQSGALGTWIVTHTLIALLFHNGYLGCSSRWLKVLERLIASVPAETREAFLVGRRLLFPGWLESADEQRLYCEQVHAYCATVLGLLSRDAALKNIIDAAIYDLDIVV